MVTQNKKSVWDVIDDVDLDAGFDGGLRLPFIYPGKFVMKIRKLAHYPSAKKKGIEWFRADLDIVTGAKDGVDAVAWVVKMLPADEEQMAMALRDIRRFVHALMGEDLKIDRDLMESLTGQDQPAEGFPIACEACNKVMGNGGNFTQTAWSEVAVDAGSEV